MLNLLVGLNLIKVIWHCWTHVSYVIQTAEDVLSGLFGFKSRLFLVLFCSLEEQKYEVKTFTVCRWNVVRFFCLDRTAGPALPTPASE